MTDPNQPPPSPLAGYIILDKKLGMTSRQACSFVRNCFRRGGAPKRIKVGHGGTLDPLATGVLVILVGKATKRQDEVMAGEKRYLAEVDLAHISPSDDREEELVPVEVTTPPTREQVLDVLPKFTGEIMQRPPAFSAISIDGQRAYALARADKAPEMKARPIVIHELKLIDYQWPIATLDIACGKGTYIRSLARDLGEALGTGGVLHSLRRTLVGSCRIEDAVTIDELPEAMDQSHLRPLDDLPQLSSPSESSAEGSPADEPAS